MEIAIIFTILCLLLLLYICMKIQIIDHRIEKIHKSKQANTAKPSVQDDEMVRLLSEAMESTEVDMKAKKRRSKPKQVPICRPPSRSSKTFREPASRPITPPPQPHPSQPPTPQPPPSQSPPPSPPPPLSISLEGVKSVYDSTEPRIQEIENSSDEDLPD